MGISVPSSWIAGLQAIVVLVLTAGFLVDQPLGVVLALAFSGLLMTQDEEGAPTEYRPITALLILSGLLFLAEYPTVGWGLALLCAALSIAALFGARPYQQIRSRLKPKEVERPAHRRR